ncbi:hypothetical protein OK074_7174 [Actinobacteria bacterium OK074]|nr:hypothetical protein OK074_7174 [Actinobacteria bacterium OK074]
MDDGTAAGRDRPYTLVVCGSCPGGAREAAMDRLRGAVRGCPHAVMVSTGCLGGLLRCRPGRGLHAVAQPCDRGRRADAPATPLGPIATDADAEKVAAWLRAGLPDDGTLPARLRAAPAPGRVAHLN